MTGNNNIKPAQRAPAALIGGQRRRLARRGGPPRSNTMPALSSSPAIAQSQNCLTSSTKAEDVSSPVNTATSSHLKTSRSTMALYPPTGFVNDTNNATSSDADAISTSSIAATTGSSSTVKDGKKKASFFDNFKTKDGAPDTAKHSPLPPSTPTKAAKLLGVDVPIKATISPTAAEEDSDIDETAFSGNFEQGHEPKSTKASSGLWSNSIKTAGKMLDSLPSPLPLGRRVAKHGDLPNLAPFSPRRNLDEDFADHVYSLADAHDFPKFPRHEENKGKGKELARHSRNAKSKSNAKQLQEMELVAEDDGDAEHDAELELIEQYSKPCRPPPVMLQHARTDVFEAGPSSYLPEVAGLAEKGLSEAIEKAHERHKAALETHRALAKMQTDVHNIVEGKGKGRADDLHGDLASLVKSIDEREARRGELDAHVSSLKKDHESFKEAFAAMASTWSAPVVETEHADDDGDSFVSTRSSIDLDEEFLVHTAKATAITRVTPGMVKLVDIPPRKKAPSADVKKWIESTDPAEQRPLSERIDPDVLRDREQPPAPLPK